MFVDPAEEKKHKRKKRIFLKRRKCLFWKLQVVSQY